MKNQHSAEHRHQQRSEQDIKNETGHQTGHSEKEMKETLEQKRERLRDEKSEKSGKGVHKHEEKHSKSADEITDLKRSLQRLQAEFENYKKREERDRVERVKFSNSDLIQKLLGVVDNFELALKHECKDKDFAHGMQMVHNQLTSLLEEEGLTPIKTLGKQFDPYLHEAVLKEKSNSPEKTVIEELQKGYSLNGKVLRTAKVKIASK